MDGYGCGPTHHHGYCPQQIDNNQAFEISLSDFPRAALGLSPASSMVQHGRQGASSGFAVEGRGDAQQSQEDKLKIKKMACMAVGFIATTFLGMTGAYALEADKVILGGGLIGGAGLSIVASVAVCCLRGQGRPADESNPV